MINNKNNIIGPIDIKTWNALRLYNSAILYHKLQRNSDVLDKIEPVYVALKESIARPERAE